MYHSCSAQGVDALTKFLYKSENNHYIIQIYLIYNVWCVSVTSPLNKVYVCLALVSIVHVIVKSELPSSACPPRGVTAEPPPLMPDIHALYESSWKINNGVWLTIASVRII